MSFRNWAIGIGAACALSGVAIATHDLPIYQQVRNLDGTKQRVEANIGELENSIRSWQEKYIGYQVGFFTPYSFLEHMRPVQPKQERIYQLQAEIQGIEQQREGARQKSWALRYVM